MYKTLNRLVLVNSKVSFSSESIFGNIFAEPKRNQYREKRLVGYSQEKVYSVVNAVHLYKNFVPFCTGSDKLQVLPNGTRVYKLTVGFPPLVESYVSNVTSTRPDFIKSVAIETNIFKFLVNEWKFTPGPEENKDSCYIDFNVDFIFKSVVYSHLANFYFDKVVSVMVDAFLKEIRRRHGPESIEARKPQILSYIKE